MEPPTRAFAHYSGTLARASSIAHWQLRDLVCCVSNPRASNSSSFSSAASVSSSLRDDDDYDPQLFVVRHCSTLRHSLRDRKVRRDRRRGDERLRTRGEREREKKSER